MSEELETTAGESVNDMEDDDIKEKYYIKYADKNSTQKPT